MNPDSIFIWRGALSRSLRSMLYLASALSSTCLLLPAAEPESEGGWRPLPLIADGKVDPNWLFIGYGQFIVDEGALRTDPDPKGLGLLVYKKQRLGNCQLKVVFKTKDARSNSGLYVRIADGVLEQVNHPGAAHEHDASGKATEASTEKVKAAAEREEGPWFGVHRGYEVQIAGNVTGSIYSLARPATTSKKAPDEWKTMIVTLAGTRISVHLDGEQISSFDTASPNQPPRKIWHEPKREPKRPEVGYIGLQTHDPGDIVWFKEISVRPLGHGASK